MNSTMRSKKNKSKLPKYICLITALIMLLVPLKAFAVYYDADFFSSNDIIFYNCQGGSGSGGSGSGGCSDIFDLSKKDQYEANDPAGQGVQEKSNTGQAEGKWAQTLDAKNRAISLGVNEGDMKKISIVDSKKMLAAEIARQYNELSEEQKAYASLEETQRAIFFYQQFEDSRSQLFSDNTKDLHTSLRSNPEMELWPSYTFDSSGACTNILSLTNDKFNGDNGRNKRAAASYDIKYAMYLGVQEHMEWFTTFGNEYFGRERWYQLLGHIFWPSQPTQYWDGVKKNAWADWDNWFKGAMGGAGYSDEEINEMLPIVNGSKTFDCSGDGGSGNSGGSGSGVDEIENGYTLPAKTGTTGSEEPVNSSGQLVLEDGVTLSYDKDGKEQYVAFSKHAAKGQKWQDYYITMRWNYVKWNWDGTYAPNPDAGGLGGWMSQDARIILVTNPSNGKSIYAAALDAGPGPWVGVDNNVNNTPKGDWVNPQLGTPSTYTGLVSGFPPKALNELGLEPENLGYLWSTEPVKLNYQWAEDQSVEPGPTSDSASGNSSSGVCGQSSSNSNSAGEYGWDMPDEGEHPMVFYDNCGGPYGGGTYGGAPICSSGCGPTSLAMVIATLTGAPESEVNPQTMANEFITNQWKSSIGTTWAFADDQNWQQKHGIAITSIGSDLTIAKETLSNGGIVLVSWEGAPFTNRGHFIILRKYTPDGHLYIASSGGTPNADIHSKFAWPESLFINGYPAGTQNISGHDKTGNLPGYLKNMWSVTKR